MLRGIRNKAIDNPFLFKIIMGGIAVAFVFSLGWGFSQQSQSNNVAIVDGNPISNIEYQRAYKNAYDTYSNIFKENFDEKMLKKLDLKNTVLDSLINKELWAIAAKEMDISISKEEIRESIMDMKVFYRDDKFSPSLYKNLLSANRIKPREFEHSIEVELSVEKAREIVKASVHLTEEEIAEGIGSEEMSGEEKDTRIRNLLFSKRERAAASYIDSMKTRIEIERLV